MKKLFILGGIIAVLLLAVLFPHPKKTLNVEEEVPAPTGEKGILPYEYESGIRGQVLMGPMCPVVREGEGCPDRPFETRIMVLRAGEEDWYASEKTDKEGKFQFELPPGNYRIGTEDKEVFPRCSPQEVTVGPKGFVDIKIFCDSGIR